MQSCTKCHPPDRVPTSTALYQERLRSALYRITTLQRARVVSRYDTVTPVVGYDTGSTAHAAHTIPVQEQAAASSSELDHQCTRYLSVCHSVEKECTSY